MLANSLTPRAILLIGAAIFSVSADASEPEFIHGQKSDARTRLVSMKAAIAHQKIVLKAFRDLQSQGHATPQEVAVAENTLSGLVGEQQLSQQMLASLNVVTLAGQSATNDADMIILPVPFVKDLYNVGSVSHVSYRLNTDDARQAAAGLRSLLKQIPSDKESAMQQLLSERHRRLCEIDDQRPGGARERKLLMLRQAAFKAATVFDRSNLPILVCSDRHYRVSGKTTHSEDDLVRLMAENTNRLRHVTQLCRLQHHTELWQDKFLMLAGLAGSEAITQAEIDYARSGVEFFRAQANSLEALVEDDGGLLTSLREPASDTALQTEIQQRSQQHTQRIQRANSKCLSLSGRVEKLTRLVATDVYFAGELAAAQRSLAVAQAQAAAVIDAESVQSAAFAFVETLTPSADTKVLVSSSTATEALQAVFRLNADTSHETAVLNAQIELAEVRQQALEDLHGNGFASWWEAASAKASLEDLRADLRRLDVIRQIGDLTVQIVENEEPLLLRNQPLAMSH